MSAFSAFERMIAFRYLRSKRKEGFVSVIATFSFLGICLGVATLIIVMSVMNGFRQELLSRILGLNGHLGVYATSSPYLDNYENLASRIAEMANVKLVMPLIEGQVMVSSDASSQGAIVRGIDFEALPSDNIIITGLSTPDVDRLMVDGEIAIGDKLAQRMRVRIGDEITLISPKGITTAFGTVPRMKSYKIGALFSVGMFEYDANFIFMPLPETMQYFATDGAVSNLEVFLKHPQYLESTKNNILEMTRYRTRLQDWQNSNSTFFNALQVERNVMFLILTLIILVASFNMISGLIMLVKDKGRNIAVLRTMGATQASIMRIFFMSGATVGILGTGAGLVLGLLFCDNIDNIRLFLQSITGTDLFSAEIYFLSRMPAEIDPMEVVCVVIMSLTLTFLATLYPAWRASRLDVVEALRHE